MSRIHKSIIVDVPACVAYQVGTQFAEFPKFMRGVQHVQQLNSRRLRCRGQIAGEEQEWDMEITVQIQDRRIAWRSITGLPNTGTVTFDEVGSDKCQIMLALQYAPQTLSENVADALGMIAHRVQSNLRRFKAFIEAR